MRIGSYAGTLRNRRQRQGDNNNDIAPTQGIAPVPTPTPTPTPVLGPLHGNEQHHSRNRPMRTSHMYCLISTVLAILAIVTSTGNPHNIPNQSVSQESTSSTKVHKSRANTESIITNHEEEVIVSNGKDTADASLQESEIHKNPNSSPGTGLLFPYTFFFSEEKKRKKATKKPDTEADSNKSTPNSFQLSNFFRWIDPFGSKIKEFLQNTKASRDSADTKSSRKKSENSRSSPFVSIFLSMVDDAFLYPNEEGSTTQVIDKIITSTPRLLAIANLLLAVTYLLHSAVADLFLGTTDDGIGSNTQNQNVNEFPRNTSTDDQRHRRAGRERLGGFLIFKLLLISAVVEPDTLDLLILLSWYTLLSFLRSLSHLAACTTNHTSQAGLSPRRGVSRLLLLVLFCDFTAAACCVALFHGAGIGMVLLLTCDCVLLALDVLVHIARHITQVLEESHAFSLSQIEERQIRLHARNRENNDIVDQQHNQEQIRLLDQHFELIEANHSRRLQIFDKAIFFIELLNALLTICHFLHIWSLHGLTCGLVDGVLALHLHTAISAASRKIVERRHIHKISRDLDGFFEDATESEIQKASASGDVCCICLCTMCVGNVKKISCGHLYHSHCLREVVERARSIEGARCPLCRASVLHGSQVQNDNNFADTFLPPNQNINPDQIDTGANVNNGQNQPETDINPPQNPPQHEHALFRFSTEGILPAWLPLPAFSFEVVRRPTPSDSDNNINNNINNNNTVNNNNNNNNNNNVNAGQRQQTGNENDNPRGQSFWRRLLLFAGAVPMSPEEESAALAQLVDMFPQYDRSVLLQELRDRMSAEAVVESILMGTFTGVARGQGNAFLVPAQEDRPLLRNGGDGTVPAIDTNQNTGNRNEDI